MPDELVGLARARAISDAPQEGPSPMRSTSGPDPLERAVGGDHLAYASLVEPLRRSVFRHCYQMLGSGLDAEDATQETLERAWRALASFSGSGSFAGWLHRIATNVCLDALRLRRSRRDPTGEGPSVSPRSFSPEVDPERFWVEPVADADLAGRDPGEEVVRREDISLAFVAALQRLAPRQRAALLLVDVLGFSHAEVAEVLGVNAGTINSLLARARQGARARPTRRRVDPDDVHVRALLDRYVQAWQLADIEAFVQLVADDVRLSMPPMSAWFEGRDAVVAFIGEVVFLPVQGLGVPMAPGWCNGQPAFATYGSGSDGRFVVNGLQVLELEPHHGGWLVESIVSFRDAELATRCGFPRYLP